VSPGDAPGYPITLSQPGHYKLMGNLVVPANTGGILITASDVTLDLNGFTVSGPVKCSQNVATLVVVCGEVAIANGSIGIRVAFGVTGTTIRNGTVRGFNQSGIRGDGSETIENVRATQNAGIGFALLGDFPVGAAVRDSVADVNGKAGFFADKALIVRSRATSNGQSGFEGIGAWGSPTVVLDSLASRNSYYGLNKVTAGRTVSLDNGSASKLNRHAVISVGGNSDQGTVY
jgi:hypothetical protein